MFVSDPKSVKYFCKWLQTDFDYKFFCAQAKYIPKHNRVEYINLEMRYFIKRYNQQFHTQLKYTPVVSILDSEIFTKIFVANFNAK